ncbi:MAG: hypothetical protein WC054_02315 [Candidatus Nanopelagicales bacterium]
MNELSRTQTKRNERSEARTEFLEQRPDHTSPLITTPGAPISLTGRPMNRAFERGKTNHTQ